MVFYKKRRYRKRAYRYRRKRYNKKRPRVGRQLKFKGSNNLILKQKRVRNFSIDSTTTLPDIRQTTFQVSDIPQIATLIELFDMYKINGVQWKLTLLQQTGAGAEVPSSCQVAIVKDMDGQASVPGQTWNNLLERPNCRIKNLSAMTTRNSCKTFIVPKVSVPVWNGAIASGYSTPKGKQWIDCGSTSVPHYGILTGLNPYQNSTAPGAGMTGTYTFQIELTYYLTFKNVR